MVAGSPAAVADATIDVGATGVSVSSATAMAQFQPKPKPKRLYFIDWLRTVMTVFVVVHHCVNTYRGELYWFVQFTTKPDFGLILMSDWITSGATMPYAMCVFFLLAGYFTPGSYRRKGPWKHLQDRLIRLVIPVLVYALVITPIILTINKAAGIPADNKFHAAFIRDFSYKELWAYWFSLKGFLLPCGPTWFVWVLFWFDFAYVCVQLLKVPLAKISNRQKADAVTKDTNNGGSSADQLPKTQPTQDANDEYPVSTVLIWTAGIIVAFTVTSFGAVMATYNSDKIGEFDGFWIPNFFIGFRPSWMGPNAISFILGTQAPKWNMLRRLPAKMTWWCLCASGIWFAFGYTMPHMINTTAKPGAQWGTYPISGAMVGWIFYDKFSYWAFGVVWSLGLLIFFRETFNSAPGVIGKQMIVGAYGAYIIHPLFIALWGWAFMQVPFATLAGYAILSSPFVVVSSWAFTLLFRLIPGTQRVLG